MHCPSLERFYLPHPPPDTPVFPVDDALPLLMGPLPVPVPKPLPKPKPAFIEPLELIEPPKPSIALLPLPNLRRFQSQCRFQSP